MTPALLGQAVVTDPGVAGASGYVLVAASPSVAPADQERLAAAPQVSDYLHVEKDLGAFFSFHRLPSGAWAFGKRFVHGTRRGSFNRIVAHTLVAPEEVLEALGWEPWLLVTSCRFRVAGGAEESHGEVSARTGEPGFRTAVDLECLLPEEPERERATLFARRRDFLLRLRGEPGLEQDLAEVMAAVEADRNALLPQGQMAEQLLLFAWSALPREDRRAMPWTTHLAPGGGSLFRLANAAQPHEARAEQADPASWALFGEPLAGASAAALARSVVANQPAFSEVCQGCDHYGLRLAGHGEVERWIAWVERGGLVPSEGFASARELSDFLDSLRIDRTQAAADPWLSPASLLEAAAATLETIARKHNSWEPADEQVYKVLEKRRLAAPLLAPANVQSVAALALACAARPLDLDTREGLLQNLIAVPKGGLGGAGLPSTPLADLALDLARGGSPDAIQALALLAREAGSLELAAARLRTRQADLPAMRAVLSAARARGERELAGKVVAERLVPLIAQQPKAAQEMPEAELAAALDALRAVPEGIVEALRTWPDELYGLAVAELRRWATGDRTAALAALGMIGHDADEPGVRELPALAGLTTALTGAGLPPGSWLPFAVAEAAVLDRGEDAHELARFADALTGLRVEAKAAAAAVPKLLRAFHKPETMPGAARRVLVQALAPGFVAHAAAVVVALSALQKLPGDAFREWGEAVEAVAVALEKGRHVREASVLRRNWLTSLATTRGSAPPVALAMIRGLDGHDRTEVGKRWASRIPDLERQLGGTELAAALRQLGPRDKGAGVDTAVAEIARDLATGQVNLEGAVARLEQMVEEPSARLVRLRKLLPQDRVGRAEAVVKLLLSPRVRQTTKWSIEQPTESGKKTSLCDEALKEAQEDLPRVLPPFEELARRGNLLDAVAKCYGELWTKEKALASNIENFLHAAVEHGQFDVVGRFLRHAEAAAPRRGFLAHLAANERDLRAALLAAAEAPVSGCYLKPFRSRLGELSTVDS